MTTDTAEIHNLVDRFFHSLDAGVFDDAWAESMLTDDVVFTMPVGADAGRAAVLQQTRTAMSKFSRTVHYGTNVVTEPTSATTADIRWNALCTHVLDSPADELFVSAGAFHGTVRREQDRWKFAALTFDAAWTRGTPPR